MTRTRARVEDELTAMREERDEHIAHGRLRLAGECCVELEQLIRELAVSRF